MVAATAFGALTMPSCKKRSWHAEGVMEKVEWVEAVNRLMLRDWCIDLSDAGFSGEELDRYWRDGEEPATFVRWFAEKHDLIRFERSRAG
jgi:hypothetical protein